MHLLAVDVLGWRVTSDTLLIGGATGLTYAILAAGLVLVYRATKVINFAHGEIGALGAAVLARLVLDWHWNYFLALLAVLALGGLIGALVELTVVRRLFRAPRLILLVGPHLRGTDAPFDVLEGDRVLGLGRLVRAAAPGVHAASSGP